MATKNLGRVTGLSAYEVWLEQGNTGTEEDFLKSLKGEKGDKGETGESAVTESNYKKLLTVGDSLSGNLNLWQPKCIELLGIPDYAIAGGAGLTISNAGADANSIYNRVMSLGVGKETTELLTEEETTAGAKIDMDTGIIAISKDTTYTKLYTYPVTAGKTYNYKGSNVWMSGGNGPMVAYYTSYPLTGYNEESKKYAVSAEKILVVSPEDNPKNQTYDGKFTPTSDGYIAIVAYNYPAMGKIDLYEVSYVSDGETALDENIDLITLWAGYNDWQFGHDISTLAEQLNKETRDNTTFTGGTLDCIEHLLSLYPTAQFVMIGTTPFEYHDMGEDWRSFVNGDSKHIEDYVNAFHEIAEHFSIPFLDLLHTSGFNEYNFATYYQEQTNETLNGIYYLHPNKLGNEKLGHRIAGFINSLNK